MALDYSNQELQDKIKRLMKPTAKPGFLSEINQNLQVTLPISSVNAPIYIRESYEEFDVTPTNYLSVSVATNAAVATGTYTNLLSVAVPSNSYLYVWGWTVGGAFGASKMIIGTLSTATAAGADAVTTLDSTSNQGSAVLTNVHVNVNYAKPISIPTGTIYLNVYHDNGANANCWGKLRYEIRRIENRSAGV